jgi:hypothetical protein
MLFTRPLTDDGGRLLDTTELGRYASARLAQAIKIRAGTCRFPTCTVPAERCDLDHHEPLPSGRHPAATWTRSADHTTGVKPSPGRHASETTSASTGPCPTPKPIDASTSPCQPAERPDGDLAHAAPAKIGGSRNSMLSDHVMWVRMGASMPPEARRCSATTVPRTTAAKTSTGLPPAIVVDA